MRLPDGPRGNVEAEPQVGLRSQVVVGGPDAQNSTPETSVPPITTSSIQV